MNEKLNNFMCDIISWLCKKPNIVRINKEMLNGMMAGLQTVCNKSGDLLLDKGYLLYKINILNSIVRNSEDDSAVR